MSLIPRLADAGDDFQHFVQEIHEIQAQFQLDLCDPKRIEAWGAANVVQCVAQCVAQCAEQCAEQNDAAFDEECADEECDDEECDDEECDDGQPPVQPYLIVKTHQDYVSHVYQFASLCVNLGQDGMHHFAAWNYGFSHQHADTFTACYATNQNADEVYTAAWWATWNGNVAIWNDAVMDQCAVCG
jgi:hypothetical protein